jgi:hypothetical protein
MSDATDLAGRVQQIEAQVAELQKAIEVLVHNPNWRELISLSPPEIERWAKAVKDIKPSYIILTEGAVCPGTAVSGFHTFAFRRIGRDKAVSALKRSVRPCSTS